VKEELPGSVCAVLVGVTVMLVTLILFLFFGRWELAKLERFQGYDVCGRCAFWEQPLSLDVGPCCGEADTFSTRVWPNLGVFKLITES